MALSWLPACVSRYSVPEMRLAPERGLAPAGFDAANACKDWRSATLRVPPDERDATLSHIAYPEAEANACFIPVEYIEGRALRPELPDGCGYPHDAERVKSELEQLARRFQAWDFEATNVPFALDCSLGFKQRARVGQINADTLRALADEIESGKRYPYAAVATFGYGTSTHNASVLNGWLPGDSCPTGIDKLQMDLFSVNRTRAYRAAQAVLVGVGPVAILSGGAVHSTLNESFMLSYLAHCRFGLPLKRILLAPCAQHTHENLRNAGGLVVRLGGRTAYLVTDDGLQADYLQEWTFFDLIGGSIDQRSLRDFRFLLGSYRQASRNMNAGFWYTPYRFWADPDPSIRGLTCLR